MEKKFVKMMQLPLFQGVSQERIEELMGKIPFHFLKYADGDQIIADGDTCDHVSFVMSGAVRVVTSSKVNHVSLSQTLQAPDVLGADYLFGINTTYPFSVYAQGGCGMVQLRKMDYVDILQSDKVFLFNILNYISRNAQKPSNSLLHLNNGLLVERLAYFVASLTSSNSINIHLDFRQKDLCSLLGARRTSLINALDDLTRSGIISYTQSSIDIADRDALLREVSTAD